MFMGEFVTGTKRGCSTNDQKLPYGEANGPSSAEGYLSIKRSAVLIYVTKFMDEHQKENRMLTEGGNMVFVYYKISQR